ncbi:hypothetical protein PPN31119_01272 [Pandoraea pnomenusa]|uniref:Uncharacterized protein n=1 Tax=Pandoraea pnomenusa TaxID=93220 RepID=A0ABY6WGH1_9BURK|nr:hypothetical protein PPN31119_01272 [Pandoraea pnomenusa]
MLPTYAARLPATSVRQKAGDMHMSPAFSFSFSVSFSFPTSVLGLLAAAPALVPRPCPASRLSTPAFPELR